MIICVRLPADTRTDLPLLLDRWQALGQCVFPLRVRRYLLPCT
jgi:hypothetical protein